MFIERFGRVVIDAPRPAVFVINRHPHMAAECMITERRNQREPRKNPLRDAPVIAVNIAITSPVQRKAERIFLDIKHHITIGLDVVERLDALMHRIDIDFIFVHVRNVRRIDAALHRLQIIALLQTLRHEHLAFRQRAPFHLGRGRLLVGRTHVGPHDAAAFDARVGLDAHALGNVRRRRHVHASARTVKFKAVIRTANAALLVATEEQRHAAVRAELVD